MGYIEKTISKNEVLIKQAKICKLSFLDRYITAILYLVGGVFAAVAMIIGMNPIAINENISIAMSAIASAGVGVLCYAILIILAVYRLVQKIGSVDKDATLPGKVFTRFALYGLAGIVVGVVTYAINGNVLDPMICDIINMAFCLVFGGLILLFAILKYKSIKLVVTDKRVFGRKNIWLTQSFDLPIDKADNIVIVFSFWGKMFNYATINIRAVEGEYKIKYVKSPEEFKNLIIDFSVNKKD